MDDNIDYTDLITSYQPITNQINKKKINFYEKTPLSNEFFNFQFTTPIKTSRKLNFDDIDTDDDNNYINNTVVQPKKRKNKSKKQQISKKLRHSSNLSTPTSVNISPIQKEPKSNKLNKNIFDVEKILGIKGNGDNIYYYIKWLDYSLEYCTWEKKSNCYCHLKIKEFENLIKNNKNFVRTKNNNDDMVIMLIEKFH